MNPVPSHLSEKPLTTASTSTAALILPRLCGAWTGRGCRDTLKQIQEACSGAQRREQNRKDFPATSHYRGGKACHKSCLEWVRVLHYFLKYFSRKPLSAIFFVGEGTRRKRGARGRGKEGGSRRTRRTSLQKHSLLSAKPVCSPTTSLGSAPLPFLHIRSPCLWALPTTPRPLTLALTICWGDGSGPRN